MRGRRGEEKYNNGVWNEGPSLTGAHGHHGTHWIGRDLMVMSSLGMLWGLPGYLVKN